MTGSKIDAGLIEQVEIPGGGAPVAVGGRLDDPRWIAARHGDLHVTDRNGCWPLYNNAEPVLITEQVRVNEPNGNASTVTVTRRRPTGARHHIDPEGMAA